MKKYQIIFNSSIHQKLENILSYIETESPRVAISIIKGIEKQIFSLQTIPERFPTIPEKIIYKNYVVRHFFYKKSFRIIYTIHQNKVRILDIRHSAQNYISENNIN
jgi:plasmid stabilization system protein ParE